MNLAIASGDLPGPGRRPLTRAYHVTTQAGFETFRIAKGDIGIHFGTKEQAADRLNWKILQKKPLGATATIPVLLDLQNPVRLDDCGDWRPSRVAQELYDQGIVDWNEISDHPRQATLRRVLRAKGYDGIVYKNRGEALGLSDVAFEEHRLRVELRKLEYMSDDWRALQAIFLEAGRRLAEIREGADDSYIVFSPDQITPALGIVQ